MTWKSIRPLWIYVIVVASILLLCNFYTQPFYLRNNESVIINASRENTLIKNSTLVVDFLVSKKCLMPSLDPWNSDIKPYYKKEKYVSCSNKRLLTYITRDGPDSFLQIDEKALRSYGKAAINCCYMNVTRRKSKENPDDNISVSKCERFQERVKVAANVIKVRCSKSRREVYSNVHAHMIVNENVRKKLGTFNSTTKPISILIVGIDSVSRLNFIRTLPETRNFLNEHTWIEYKAYNKMGDNTFPNLMAILTGRNETSSFDKCNPTILGKLDSCNFIWKDYGGLGYVTSYAEDEATLSTFNYLKKGFNSTPTDYYYRSYLLAAHTLKMKRLDGMTYCTGPETSGERILRLALDFSATFVNRSSFGFFWMNSFSHNEANSPTRMDAVFLEFFRNLRKAGVLENAMIIFLSDHGMRFGKMRESRSGWLEERLPFLYFSLPTWFKEKFVKKYESIKSNGLQLTSPYDLHMTLQDVLVLSDLNYTIKQSEGCPNCQSLFKAIETERLCNEIGIEPHWCTCAGYQSIESNQPFVTRGANFVVQEINAGISRRKEGKQCTKFTLGTITSSSISTATYTNDTYLLLVVKTVPKAVFEVTLNMYLNGTYFKRTGGISRLDMYHKHGYCVTDSYLKMLCYCH